MRNGLVGCGLVVVAVVSVTATSAAQPGADPSCDSILQDRTANRARESPVIEQFSTAVQAGNCGVVARLDAQVRELDPAYYRCGFAGHPVIAACMPAPAAAAAIDSSERAGLMVGAAGEVVGASGAIIGLATDVRIGWQIQPWIAVFALAGTIVGAGDGGPVGLLEVGVRLSLDRLFVDARIGWARTPSECDDEPCPSPNTRLQIFGGGVELIRHRHFSLDLHLERVSTPDGSGYLGGVGFTGYL
jgi:hypothetical protein